MSAKLYGGASLRVRGLDALTPPCQTKHGMLEQPGPVMRMSKMPPEWRCPPPEPGADLPQWIAA
ncbi:MAG TPA: hypothetical protein VII49_13230 [Rhizomicrobium sp.]